MGFDRPEDAQKAALGSPLATHMIRLDALQKYQPGTKVNALLGPTQEFMFPVLVDGTTRSSISMVLIKGSWRPASFGAPFLSRELVKVREARGRDAEVAAPAMFLVKVPALKVHFIAYRKDGGLFFASVVDDRRFGFKAGEAMPAEKAIEKMLPAARRHNGAPG